MKISDQRGASLIELLVVMALVAFIVTGASMTIFQLNRLSARNEAVTTVNRNVQNVGFRINQDLLMAESVNATDDISTPEVEFLSLIWKDWESGDNFEVRYSWRDDVPELKDVMRYQAVYDLSGVKQSETNAMVAQQIAGVAVTQSDGLVSVNISARAQDAPTFKQYQITQRVE